MQKSIFKPGILAGALTALVISAIPQTAVAYQDGIAIRNKGGGGYFKAYRDLFECRDDSPSDATCIKAFNECGPIEINVYITMKTAETIVDPDWGDYLQVVWVENGSVSSSICTGQIR